jgi:hypothetical protein
MALLAAVVFAPFKFKHHNFFATLVLDNFRSHTSRLHGGSAEGDVSAIANHEDRIEFDRLPHFTGEAFDINGIPWFYTILPPTAFHHCVHNVSVPFAYLHDDVKYEFPVHQLELTATGFVATRCVKTESASRCCMRKISEP